MKMKFKGNPDQRLKDELPSVQDQLDEIWRRLDALKVKSPMLDQIKAIKAKYSKPL